MDGVFVASHRFARINPRKARLVVDLIRGMKVSSALELLKVTEKRGADLVAKVVKSAAANAEQKEADVRKLVIMTAAVDEGPRIKRFQPKDRGRAHPIVKGTSHIKISVVEA